MTKLKLKSFKSSILYLILFSIFLIGGIFESLDYIEHSYICEDLIVYLIIALIGVVGISAILFCIISGRCQKDIYKYIRESYTPAVERERIENFLSNADSLHNLRYDRNYICNKKGIFTTFMKTQDVVKAYKKTKIHRYILPIFKSCELVFITADGKRRTIDFVREKHMDEALAILREICPQARIK